MINPRWASVLIATLATVSGAARADDATTNPAPDKNGQTEATDPGSAIVYETWEFEIDVQATQHEPAGKSVDAFTAKLQFWAGFKVGSPGPSKYVGPGVMVATEISRAPGSFQAAHRAKPQFHVVAKSQRDFKTNTIQVSVTPQDQVTYSLTTGEELGTLGILELMLPDAVFTKIPGHPLDFTIPADLPAPAEFHARFNTKDKHTCWYEGEATLRLVRRWGTPKNKTLQP